MGLVAKRWLGVERSVFEEQPGWREMPKKLVQWVFFELTPYKDVYCLCSTSDSYTVSANLTWRRPSVVAVFAKLLLHFES